jgi:DNA repair ATPase RecN
VQTGKSARKTCRSLAEIRKVAPDLPEASEISEPEQQIELLQEAWTQLTTCMEKIQEKLQQVQQEAEQQPRQLQDQMQRIILQGNNARVTLHKKTTDCTRIFKEVSDWMGIIARRNQVLEEVHTKIQVLNEEVAVTMDPIEQQQKFDQIQ